ncbi:MAG TPA: LysR family transcriptional regulator substrate-binding protein [Candidatus Limnocylindria bacterium]|jgi:DNA-binding transcriptional LysR family regulator|nr:LysR family transcriptional regulator substrate-binding protein [Candidatus Limnocylindria bacterium]
MLASAETVLHQLDRTLEELNAMTSFDTGSLVVGSGSYFGSYLLPFICASFHQMVPGIRTHIYPARGVDCIEALRRRHVDLAVTGCDDSDGGIVRKHLADKDTVWIAPLQHRLASRQGISFGEIAAQDLVLPPVSSSNRGALDKWAAEHGSELHPRLEVTGVEAQVTAVRSGLGIAAVPAHVLSRYSDAPLRVLSVLGFPLRRSWSVVWRDEELSPAGTAFRDYLVAQRAKIEETSLYSPRGTGTSAPA